MSHLTLFRLALELIGTYPLVKWGLIWYLVFRHYNPLGLRLSYTQHLCCVCVNFIYEWWNNLQLKVDFEWQIFQKLFHNNFIYSPRVCQKSAERKSPEKYFFIFRYVVNICPGVWTGEIDSVYSVAIYRYCRYWYLQSKQWSTNHIETMLL